jgi:nucleoside-diphosphate-sugar epimerase
MKVLITGGTGFVGRNFIKHASQQSWDIALLTRKRANVADLAGPNIRVYEGDVSDPAMVDRIAAGEGRLDAVIHLAASLVYFSPRPAIHRFNVEGTQNMLSVAERTQAARFVYASSIEAAGGVRTDEIPAPTNRPPRPISSYGWSKVLAEQAVRARGRGKFKTAILRIGNVYGTDHLNFITFIADSIINRTRVLEFLPYYQDRYIQPVHNQDVTDGLLAASRCQEEEVTATLAGEYATVGHVFDVCSEIMGKPFKKGRGKRWVDLVYLLLRREYHRYQGGGGDLITYMMAGRGRAIHRAYSLAELETKIGYTPRFTLTKGISDSLAWAKANGTLRF